MAIEMVNPGSARSKLGCLKSFSRNMEKQIASYFHAGNISVLGGKSPALGEILARHCWMKDLQIWSSSRFELQRSLRESNGGERGEHVSLKLPSLISWTEESHPEASVGTAPQQQSRSIKLLLCPIYIYYIYIYACDYVCVCITP